MAWTAKAKPQCYAAGQVNPGDYGRIVRIDITAAKSAYLRPDASRSPLGSVVMHGRSPWKRINNRIDNSFCFEKSTLSGASQNENPYGLALAVIDGHGARHVKGGTHRADALAGSADSTTG